MLKNYRLLLLIACIFALEGIIYLWSIWTVIDVDFIFEKCARNSGRASAALNLILIFSLGYYGLKKIYADETKKDWFRILVTLFTVNHLIHFYFVYNNFISKSVILEPADNKHGMITFILILLFPIVIWSVKNLNRALYFGIILHFFNTTYFIIETFYFKIKPEKPAYLHQIGIGIMLAVLLFIIYRSIREQSNE